MQVVFTGTVVQGVDAAGNDLTGQAYTATYVYDTALGVRTTDPAYDYVYGGSVYGVDSPIVSATVTIDGDTSSVNGDYYGLAYQTDSYYAQYYAIEYFEDGSGYDYEYLYFNFSDLGVPVDLEQPYSIDLATSDPNYYYGQYGYQNYNYDTGVYESSYAYLGADRVTVSYYNPAPIPLPAGGLMLIGGLGALAALKRRRRA